MIIKLQNILLNGPNPLTDDFLGTRKKLDLLQLFVCFYSQKVNNEQPLYKITNIIQIHFEKSMSFTYYVNKQTGFYINKTVKIPFVELRLCVRSMESFFLKERVLIMSVVVFAKASTDILYWARNVIYMKKGVGVGVVKIYL